MVAFDEATGRVVEAKASTTPRDFAQGVFDAIRVGDIPAASVAAFVHGTTVVINAITQRSGVKTALVTTAGFRDVLEIGRANRPDMYNLKFHKPRPIVPRRLRFEVRERVAANGTVRVPLAVQDLEDVVAACREQGVVAIAVSFLHAYAHPQHEAEAVRYLRERLPGVAVSASSEITKEWREYERTSTTVLNAYVQPILDQYLGDLEGRLRSEGMDAAPFVMLSNGGTGAFAAARRQPILLVESGPVAGVTGAALIGDLLGEPNVIALDIGGTTAKCSLIEGGEVKITTDYRLERTPRSPGYPVKVPVVDIVEIGAGGGSIAWFDEGGALRVGPMSAGADPGPACYGRGGIEPTVTDAMLLTGALDPRYVLGGKLSVDVGLAREAYDPVARRLGVTVEEAAAGVIRLLNEHTIDALKLISVRRGYDPRDFTLVAFGGGGPIHAAALAEELGVKRVVIPPYPGTFSAWGMLMTQPRVDLVQTRVLRLERTSPSELATIFAASEREAAGQLATQGFPPEAIAPARRSLDMRYRGQEHTVEVPVTAGEGGLDQEALAASFHARHRQRYTFALADTPIEIVNFRTITVARTTQPTIEAGKRTHDPTQQACKGVRLVDFGAGPDHLTPTAERSEASVYERGLLPVGFRAAGPLVVEEPSATTLVRTSQTLEVDHFGNLVISP